VTEGQGCSLLVLVGNRCGNVFTRTTNLNQLGSAHQRSTSWQGLRPEGSARATTLADGSKAKSVTFTIRSLRIGDKVVENVRGSVAPAQGSLLLGQSFLEHFKS